MSNFDDIFNGPKINTSKLVFVFKAGKTWNEDVYCKPCPKRSYRFWMMEAAKLQDLQKSEELNQAGFITTLMAKLVCLCACNESGQMVFSYNEDVEKLCGLKDTSILEKLFKGACQVNGIEPLAIQISKTFAEFDKLFDDVEGEAKAPGKKPKAKRKPRVKKTPK